MRYKISQFLAASLFFVLSSSARAEWLTFEMHWASPHSDAPVTVDGLATFEVNRQTDGSYMGGAEIDTVRDYSLTIANARFGNGTFTKLESTVDWYPVSLPGWIYFDAGTDIDLTKDLVGQSAFRSESHLGGTDRRLGGLVVYGPMAIGFVYQTVSLNEWWDKYGEVVLTSVKVLDYYVAPTPVPEPKSYAMMLAGIALVSVATRRRFERSAS